MGVGGLRTVTVIFEKSELKKLLYYLNIDQQAELMGSRTLSIVRYSKTREHSVSETLSVSVLSFRNIMLSRF
jgi:hypothetical protein